MILFGQRGSLTALGNTRQSKRRERMEAMFFPWSQGRKNRSLKSTDGVLISV